MSSPKPRIILGLMTYGPDSFPDNRVTTVSELKNHFDIFQTQYGYTEIDTARIYSQGQQEKFTTQAGWKGRGLELATKSYPRAPGTHTATNLRRDLETSLSELGTDSVDIFYLHAADRAVPFTETLEAANALYQEGKFKKLGLSNYSAYEVAEIVMLCKARSWVQPSIYQGIYNILSRNLETEVIPACKRYGLDVVIYSPLGGGLLTGRYSSSSGSDNTQQGRFHPSTLLGPFFQAMYFKDDNFRALDIIRRAADKHGLTLTEVALRWCIHHSALTPANKGGNDGVIIGASKAEYLHQNITDLNKGPLPEDVVQAAEEAWMISMGSSPNPWHTPLVYTYKGFS